MSTNRHVSTNEFLVGDIVMSKLGDGLHVNDGHGYHLARILVIIEVARYSARAIDPNTRRGTWVTVDYWEVVWVGP